MADDPERDNVVVRLNRNLDDITTCNLYDAWARIKPEIEMRIGKDLVCIPYVTEGHLYDITSVFVKVQQSGGIGRRFRTYKSLGKLEDLIIQEKSSKSWHDITSKIPGPVQMASPKSFKLKIFDREHHKNISVLASNFYKKFIPDAFSPVGKVTFNKQEDPGLAEANTVYLVNKVLLAEILELRINVREYSRVFYYGTVRPFMIGYQKFQLNSTAEVISKKATVMCSARAKWTGVEKLCPSTYFLEEVRSSTSRTARRRSSLFM